MSDKIDMTEEEFEKRLNQTHQSGINSGIESAAHLVLDEATGFFRRSVPCKDHTGIEKAKLLRTLHETILDLRRSPNED